MRGHGRHQHQVALALHDHVDGEGRQLERVGEQKAVVGEEGTPALAPEVLGRGVVLRADDEPDGGGPWIRVQQQVVAQAGAQVKVRARVRTVHAHVRHQRLGRKLGLGGARQRVAGRLLVEVARQVAVRGFHPRARRHQVFAVEEHLVVGFVIGAVQVGCVLGVRHGHVCKVQVVAQRELGVWAHELGQARPVELAVPARVPVVQCVRQHQGHPPTDLHAGCPVSVAGGVAENTTHT